MFDLLINSEVVVPDVAVAQRVFVEALGWRFEVVDIDGRRIDKVLITKVSSADAAELHRRASLRAAGS